ncbi:hypothetical protein STCU_00656 [Strigomonas culicis]|uniref:TerD domain-containing protein n=1 Tax=Strigomonas culicis TaxID=28005 RepID=S9UZL2_9TRYP|nr:hypothetical protein STCU_00656 [Strigomonas culicis]|eukprot:EPY36297.1 hypothetical protein STCU_00656 [Strigomonas culicis]
MSTDIRQKVFRIPDNIVFSVGLSWDYIGADPLDLDLSAVCFTQEGQFLDVVFFNHLFPEGTDEAALRNDYLIDTDLLPYMFLSGDSHVGGEEENQLPGMALAARRRLHAPTRRGRRDIAAAGDDLFTRIYEEEEVSHVQRALDAAYTEGGAVYNEDGALMRQAPRRELCDEVLTFVMPKMPRETDVVFICVSSYTGVDFTSLGRVRLVLHNETTGERVGVMDLKSSTGNGTANLSAMLVRVPSGSDDVGPFWDLRELNIRSSGYTFVDVLPIMQRVLGIPPNSRLDSVANLPDYPLAKVVRHLAEHPLSDVRFGIGWRGEHDVDAFLVLLDGDNNYVDHIYPKGGRLCTGIAHMARHSGDALSGTAGHGDQEFIDLLTYRVPPTVRTILVGATYMESFGPDKGKYKSAYDIPLLYMRLQNRTMENPFSFEVDRWNVYEELYETGAHDVEVTRKRNKRNIATTYRGPDRAANPVRTLLLGAMVQSGTIPFEQLFPDGRRIDQLFRRAGGSVRPGNSVAGESIGLSMEAAPQQEVPLFEFVPIHQSLPVDPTNGFARVIPLLQAVAAHFVLGDEAGAGARPPAPGAEGTTAVGKYSGKPVDIARLWRDVSAMDNVLDRHAVQIQFLEITNLEPQLPDRFKCHAEAWLYGRTEIPARGREITIDDNLPIKSPHLFNRDQLVWGENATGVFIVHKYDRIRISVYEFASYGVADVDLLQMPELFMPRDKRTGKQGGVEVTLQLCGAGDLFKGEIRVRLSRVSMHSAAVQQREKEVRHANRKRAEYTESQEKRRIERANAGTIGCSVI